jgi:site-specific DNA recombinase
MATKPTKEPGEIIAIGMSRVSLIKQVSNYSLDAQDFKFDELEKKFGCKIPPALRIEDEGYSGADFNRPSIRKALKAIRNGEANAIAFPWLDRFARNLEGGLATIRRFREAGAHVLLGDYGWYSDERSFKTQMQLGLMIAEWQRDDINEKSRSGIEQKIRRGLAHGGSPFGWRFVTGIELAAEAIKEKREIPDKPQNVHRRVEQNQQTVHLMGNLALEGHSLASICRELLARGIKSPSGQARWNPRTVARILRDPCYHTGEWHYNKRQGVAPEKIRKPDPS